MSASKTLTSSVVAAALVGAIGFAYAQSSSTEGAASPQPNSSTQMENQSATTTPSTTDSSATTPAPADTSSAPLPERAPQADRN